MLWLCSIFIGLIIIIIGLLMDYLDLGAKMHQTAPWRSNEDVQLIR